jgi:hypothetical protein
MNLRLKSLASALLLAAQQHALADDTVRLRCNFAYGQIEINVNYTRGTVNDATAMIDDKEIVWTPPGGSGGLAVINRYSGIMQMSKGSKEYTGMCNRVVEQ